MKPHALLIALTFTVALAAACGVILLPDHTAHAECRDGSAGYCFGLATVLPQHENLAQTGLEFLNIPANASVGDVLVRLYTWALSLLGISALVMTVYGGVMYMTAAGNQSKIGRAKGVFQNVAIGIALALTSWLILYTINPDLVRQLDLESALPDLNTVNNANQNNNTPPPPAP